MIVLDAFLLDGDTEVEDDFLLEDSEESFALVLVLIVRLLEEEDDAFAIVLGSLTEDEETGFVVVVDCLEDEVVVVAIGVGDDFVLE